jgi:hypothetical protein
MGGLYGSGSVEGSSLSNMYENGEDAATLGHVAAHGGDHDENAAENGCGCASGCAAGGLGGAGA